MSFNWKEIKIFLFFRYKTFASEQSPWQQQGVISIVHFPNHYIRANLEKVLPITFRDIHHVINIIYYSWVDDVKRFLICACLKNLNISETKQDFEKLEAPLSLLLKYCSVAIKISWTTFSRREDLLDLKFLSRHIYLL